MADVFTRRGVLGGLAIALAAPAVVRASSLMPVRAIKFEPVLYEVTISPGGVITSINILSAGSGYTIPPVLSFNPPILAKIAKLNMPLPTKIISHLDASDG